MKNAEEWARDFKSRWVDPVEASWSNEMDKADVAEMVRQAQADAMRKAAEYIHARQILDSKGYPKDGVSNILNDLEYDVLERADKLEKGTQ